MRKDKASVIASFYPLYESWWAWWALGNQAETYFRNMFFRKWVTIIQNSRFTSLKHGAKQTGRKTDRRTTPILSTLLLLGRNLVFAYFDKVPVIPVLDHSYNIIKWFKTPKACLSSEVQLSLARKKDNFSIFIFINEYSILRRLLHCCCFWRPLQGPPPIPVPEK